MIGLRIIGGLFGSSLLLWAFFSFRNRRMERSSFSIAAIMGLSLFILAVKPSVADVVRDVLLLKKIQYGRLFVVLIVSNLLTWFVLVYLRQDLDTKRRELDVLVLKLGLDEFWKKYGDVRFEKIAVVIPAYNELDNLKILVKVINQSVSNSGASILIVDDSSSDGTSEYEFQQGCYVVSNKINRGGGTALNLGYMIASRAGASVIVTMDADNQHDPSHIPSLVEPVVHGDADIVIGSRIMGKNKDVQIVKLAGVYFYNVLIRVLTGARVTDCSSGFRAFRTESLMKLRLEESRYHTSELIIEGVRNGLSITEVPITMRPRLFGKSKKGGLVRYGLSFLRVVLQTWWRRKN